MFPGIYFVRWKFSMCTATRTSSSYSPIGPSVFFCVFSLGLYYYRQDAAKRQTAGIVFTHRPKIRFFAPQGRLVAPIQAKLCSTDGHRGPLGCAKFHVNRCRRWECGPQNIKNFHFLVKSRPAGATPLTDFQNF